MQFRHVLEIISSNNESDRTKNHELAFPMPPRIFLAPLDWGMGHATRCVPVIHALLENGAEVILGASGRGYVFLQKEFPDLELIRLTDYGIVYTSRGLQPFHFLCQLPRLITTIRKEQNWLRQFILKRDISGIISDNRFGIYSSLIPSVCISHQLNVKTLFGSKIASAGHQKFLNRFDAIWVPDNEGVDNLSGELGHTHNGLQKEIHYVGALSRINYRSATNSVHADKPILVLLSGPEPQRTVFEEILLPQLIGLNRPVVLARGLPDTVSSLSLPKHITVYNHLSGDQFQQAIEEAYIVIARSGYSTLCDVALAGKYMIAVPTPGQTEQEYLAEYLSKQNRLITQKQNEINLEEAFLKVPTIQPLKIIALPDLLHRQVDQFIKMLKSN